MLRNLFQFTEILHPPPHTRERKRDWKISFESDRNWRQVFVFPERSWNSIKDVKKPKEIEEFFWLGKFILKTDSWNFTNLNFSSHCMQIDPRVFYGLHEFSPNLLFLNFHPVKLRTEKTLMQHQFSWDYFVIQLTALWWNFWFRTSATRARSLRYSIWN